MLNKSEDSHHLPVYEMPKVADRLQVWLQSRLAQPALRGSTLGVGQYSWPI